MVKYCHYSKIIYLINIFAISCNTYIFHSYAKKIIPLINACVHFSTPNPLDLRLQGPSSRDGSGRVEIYEEQWLTIRSRSWRWGFDEATVVCRQLGFKNGVVLQDVPSGTGPTLVLKYISCSGSESDLNSCYQERCCSDKCERHTDDVGVNCSLTGIVTFIEL